MEQLKNCGSTRFVLSKVDGIAKGIDEVDRRD